MNSQTEIIKDRLNILDVVSDYVKLEKAGKVYKGKSPFNQERTPSFFVHPDKGFFYDFSAGFGGDIFTFIEKIEHVDFPEALKILAEKAGIVLNFSPEAKKQQNERERLFSLLDLATKWYEVQLRKNKEVVDYLIKKRGLKKETIVSFRLGFISEGWNAIYDYLKAKGFKDIEIERAGLVVQKQGAGYYDRFRSRIMFPLFDGRGRVVGFSGRIWGENEKAAKYINSPEGPLFNKSRILYGYHKAKSTMSKEDYCILVEGQFDVLLSQQAGYQNTVAISGTGLTKEHAEMISRFTSNIYLALDGDKAGIKATRRSILLAYEKNMRVKIVQLEEEEDPADTIFKSKEAWDIAVLEKKDYIDYRISIAERSNLDFEKKHDFVYKDLFQFVSFVKSAVAKDKLLQKIALFLGVSFDAVKNDFLSYQPEIILLREKIENKEKIHTEEKDTKRELLFLIFFLKEKFSEDFKEKQDSFVKMYENVFHTSIDDKLDKLSKEELSMSEFVFEENFSDKNFLYFYQIAFTLLKNLELKKLEEDSVSVQERIRKAQILQPNILPRELMQKSSDIRKKIDSIKNTLIK